LAQTWRRNRLMPFLHDVAGAWRAAADLGSALHQVGEVMRRLSHDAIAAATPLVEHAVQQFLRRPDQISKTAELDRLRQRWIDRQMKRWLDADVEAHPSLYWWGPVEFYRAQIARDERAAEARTQYARDVKSMTPKALRDFATDLDLQEQVEEQMEELRMNLRPRPRPGPRMG
jgi:hypothetical protein